MQVYVNLVPVRHPAWSVWLAQRAVALGYEPDRLAQDAAAIELGVHCDRQEEVRCLRALTTLLKYRRTTDWILAMHAWYGRDHEKLMRAADTLRARGDLLEAELLEWSVHR